MLTNMMKMIPSPAAHACQARYRQNGVLSVFRFSKRFSSVFRTESPVQYGGHTVRQRLVIGLADKQLELRPRSMWSLKSCVILGTFTRRSFSRINHSADISTSRNTWSSVHSEGGIEYPSDVSSTSPPVGTRMHISSADTHPKIMSERKLPAGSNERLVKAILYEAQRGFVNVTGKSKRFGDFLSEQITFLADLDQESFSPESWDTFRQLSQDSRRYDQMEEGDRISLLNRVARSIGFENLQDLLDHDNASTEASQGLNNNRREGETPVISPYTSDLESREIQSANKQATEDKPSQTLPMPLSPMHPGIMFGSSQPIELCSAGGQSSFLTSLQIVEGKSETSATINSVPAKAKKVALKKVKRSAPAGGKVASESKMEQTAPIVKIDAKNITVSKRSSLNDNWGMDTPMSSMKCLSTYLRSRLEENGFITMRMLLQHFPRMYRNFQAAGQRVEDGQHLSFVGTIVQSKGLPRGPSLGMTEVIIRSEVEPTSTEDLLSVNGDGTSNDETPGQIVFLHLKKFYRGSRYASSWFLNAMANKYPLSSQVTVCGKVGGSGDCGMAAIQSLLSSSEEGSVFLVLKFELRLDWKPSLPRLHKQHLQYFSKAISSSPQIPSVCLRLLSGASFFFLFKVKAMHQPDHFEIREYNLELWDEDKDTTASVLSLPETNLGGKPYPVYSAKGGLQSKTIEFSIQRVLPIIPFQLDPLPEVFRKKWELQELRQAYVGIHSPQDSRDAELARQRLVFDEFFYLQLGMLLPRQELAGKYLAAAGMADPALVSKSGVLSMENWSPLTLKIVKSLPYTLTQSQIRAAGEIMWDLQRPVPMSRLLQGDVGCGKTVVAFLALIEVVDAGYQGALMAPTEFLAVQHYQRISSWLEKLDESERPRVALLTGSIPVSKARVIRSGFESGEIDLAVGTHSLIADSVKFSALRLGVIDEQHRFGVAQRGRLNNKVRDDLQLPESIGGDVKSTTLPPHVLAMSATPIPRTLALALHGDMALSQITELPPGRPETATYAILGDEKGREEVYQKVREELENGGQVFVVYPVIEESEELPDVRAAESEFKNLELEFREHKCGLVHGRMRAHEKDEAMERFKMGETKVLVSTTVIEVGIDIPEASMIVIEHAERYGMAQLHQLRGRVGRGTRDASCILLASRSSSLSRLKMLETSRDGFYLAEIDLKLRGPGDLLGKQQSGYLPEFHIARLEKDGELLEKARDAAEELLQLHPNLEGVPRIRQELSMRRPPSALS